jgi:2-phosphosulfolactate phosphatase
MLFAGAVVSRVKEHFTIECDSSQIADIVYQEGKADLFAFMKARDASHYHRLSKFGLEKDISYCLTPDVANVLPVYDGGKLVI